MEHFRILLTIISLLFFIGVFLLTSCSTVTKVESPNTGIKPRVNNCNITFFNGTTPKKNFITLSKVETHIKINFFFGGKVNLDDDAFDELRDKGCELGGDAVIIDDFIETEVLEYTHIHVWATIIKFVDKNGDSILAE